MTITVDLDGVWRGYYLTVSADYVPGDDSVGYWEHWEPYDWQLYNPDDQPIESEHAYALAHGAMVQRAFFEAERQAADDAAGASYCPWEE